MIKLVAFLASVLAAVLGAAGIAAAQYPPPGVTSIVPPNPTPGSTVTITGNCGPNATITVVLVDGTDAAALTASGQAATVELAAVRTLGTTTADPNGAFSVTVTIPTDVASPAFLQVSGSTCGTLATVAVLAQVTQPTTAPTTAPSGGFASTGSRADVMFPLAIALVVAGSLIVLAVRQRRRRRVPTNV